MVATSVGIAELKSRLSEYLRAVRRGSTVTVLDRDTPVARLVPIDREAPRLQVRRPRKDSRIQEVDLPPALAIPFDVMEVLQEERGRR